MMSVLLVAAIAVAVVLGYKTKINTGFFCIVFAYLIGCFGLGMKTKALISCWPTSTMFVILAVSLFYNFAAINGTLEKLSAYLLYTCRKFPGLLPFALFFVAVALSIMGAAFFTVLAFLAPITLLICEEAKMDKLTGAVAINAGALAGGNFPTAALGVVFRGLIDTAYESNPGLAAPDTFVEEMKIFAFAVFFSLIIIAIFRFGLKSNRDIGKGVTFRKPDPFDPKQRLTLNLMLVMMAVVLIFPVIHLLLPGVEIVAYISSKVDVGLVAICFAVIALLLKLAPEKEVITRVPWNTILMIAGAGMLIAVAVEAGTIDALSSWIGSNVPVALVPLAFSLVGAFMSFFSSTTGVVAPALFPLIPALAASTGLNPAVLFACTILGAQSSAISPFSSGGRPSIWAIISALARTAPLTEEPGRIARPPSVKLGVYVLLSSCISGAPAFTSRLSACPDTKKVMRRTQVAAGRVRGVPRKSSSSHAARSIGSVRSKARLPTFSSTRPNPLLFCAPRRISPLCSAASICSTTDSSLPPASRPSHVRVKRKRLPEPIWATSNFPPSSAVPAAPLIRSRGRVYRSAD